MSQLVYPPQVRQKFSIKGEGSFSLTEAQRSAKSIVITVEKVITGFVYDYFNFSTPEPEGQWGYLQLMAQDFVVETQQLQYRRQVVRHWDRYELDPIEQLRCLIRNTGVYIDTSIGDTQEALGVLRTDRIAKREIYNQGAAKPRVIPVDLVSSVWYKIDVGRAAFVTITHQAHANPECPVEPVLVNPGATPPKKDESGGPGGGGSAGGGGYRDPGGPPPGQSGDNSSDSSGPTQGTDVPPSPTDSRDYGGGGVGGQTKVVWGQGEIILDSDCSREEFGPVTDYIPGDIDPATIAVGATQGTPVNNYCGTNSIDRSVYLLVGGAQYGRSYGSAKFTVLPSIISVEYIP